MYTLYIQLYILLLIFDILWFDICRFDVFCLSPEQVALSYSVAEGGTTYTTEIRVRAKLQLLSKLEYNFGFSRYYLCFILQRSNPLTSNPLDPVPSCV